MYSATEISYTHIITALPTDHLNETSREDSLCATQVEAQVVWKEKCV